jgi:hypothetical protein
MRISSISTLGVGLFILALALGASAGTNGDVDNDTVPDALDNCMLAQNGPRHEPNNQCDTDQDGYGNACDFDVNQDNVIGAPDFGCFTFNFGLSGHPISNCDSNCDGVIGAPDFGLFTSSFGGSVGPSGLSCAGTIPCP